MSIHASYTLFSLSFSYFFPTIPLILLLLRPIHFPRFLFPSHPISKPRLTLSSSSLLSILFFLTTPISAKKKTKQKRKKNLIYFLLSSNFPPLSMHLCVYFFLKFHLAGIKFYLSEEPAIPGLSRAVPGNPSPLPRRLTDARLWLFSFLLVSSPLVWSFLRLSSGRFFAVLLVVSCRI